MRPLPGVTSLQYLVSSSWHPAFALSKMPSAANAALAKRVAALVTMATTMDFLIIFICTHSLVDGSTSKVTLFVGLDAAAVERLYRARVQRIYLAERGDLGVGNFNRRLQYEPGDALAARRRRQRTLERIVVARGRQQCRRVDGCADDHILLAFFRRNILPQR